MTLDTSGPGCGRKVSGKDASGDEKLLIPQARSAGAAREASKGLSAWRLPATCLDPAARRLGGAVASGHSPCLTATCSGWASGVAGHSDLMLALWTCSVPNSSKAMFLSHF